MVFLSFHSFHLYGYFWDKEALQETVFYNIQTVLDLVNQKSAAWWFPNTSAWWKLNGCTRVSQWTYLIYRFSRAKKLEILMQQLWSWAQESVNFKILLVWFCYTASLGNPCLIIHPLLIFQVEDQDQKKWNKKLKFPKGVKHCLS